MKIIIDLTDKELKHEYDIPNWVYNVTIDVNDKDLMDLMDYKSNLDLDITSLYFISSIVQINEQNIKTFIPQIGWALLRNIELYIFDIELDQIKERINKYF